SAVCGSTDEELNVDTFFIHVTQTRAGIVIDRPLGRMTCPHVLRPWREVPGLWLGFAQQARVCDALSERIGMAADDHALDVAPVLPFIRLELRQARANACIIVRFQRF